MKLVQLTQSEVAHLLTRPRLHALSQSLNFSLSRRSFQTLVNVLKAVYLQR